jgi:1,4-alpha-glucan branching enzyme
MVVMAPSERPGMGSVPFPGGVTFRVWAPNASAAAVSLAQPGGEWTSVPLAAEAGGIWSAEEDRLQLVALERSPQRLETPCCVRARRGRLGR